MENYLTPYLDDEQMHKLSTLALAHIGDSVFEMLTRSMLVKSGVLTSKNLHRETTSYVSASAQAKSSSHIIDLLTDQEKAYFIRGRNSKPKTVPKSSSREEYGLATALETLFGYLYLKQEYDRINFLYSVILDNFKK